MLLVGLLVYNLKVHLRVGLLVMGLLLARFLVGIAGTIAGFGLVFYWLVTGWFFLVQLLVP
jgi:hypothetical protein